jgi:hypothetical protein
MLRCIRCISCIRCFSCISCLRPFSSLLVALHAPLHPLHPLLQLLPPFFINLFLFSNNNFFSCFRCFVALFHAACSMLHAVVATLKRCKLHAACSGCCSAGMQQRNNNNKQHTRQNMLHSAACT